ncbi:MAG TPA: hypothetical protein VGM80_09630 [Gaiellaceae bacterium]
MSDDGTSAPNTTPVKPALTVPLKPTGRYTGRFALLYVGLGVVMVGAVAAIIVAFAGSGIGSGHASGSWSTWKPSSGTTAKVTTEIATHVAQEYHLNAKGAPFVAVVSGPPQLANGTHKVEISHVALKKTATTDSGIQIFPAGSTWTDQLCGLGTGCSIATGQPTEQRGRLVRREALEVALYTFKFAPAIQSVVAFMPPPPGQTASTLLYLQKDNLKQQLSQPLSKTLPLTKPPLPSEDDPTEAPMIDKLTPVFNYSVQQLQDNSALLIIAPAE